MIYTKITLYQIRWIHAKAITTTGNTVQYKDEICLIGRLMMILCTLCPWQRCNRSCADHEGGGSGMSGTTPPPENSNFTYQVYIVKLPKLGMVHPTPGKTKLFLGPPSGIFFGSAPEFYGLDLGVRWSVTFFAGAVNVLVTDSRFLGLPGGKEIRKFLMSCE